MFTPQTRVQFDYGLGGDEAEEERTEILDFLAALECFVKVAANILESDPHAPPSTSDSLMPNTLVGEGGVSFVQSSVSELQLPIDSEHTSGVCTTFFCKPGLHGWLDLDSIIGITSLAHILIIRNSTVLGISIIPWI